MNSTAIKNKFANICGAAPNKITFSWNGNSYTGVRTQMRQDAKYSEYGYGSGYEFSIVCKRDDFATSVPSDDDKITVNGEDKRIILVEQDAVDTAVTLHIGDYTA